jgi:hypothetical protein
MNAAEAGDATRAVAQPTIPHARAASAYLLIPALKPPPSESFG